MTWNDVLELTPHPGLSILAVFLTATMVLFITRGPLRACLLGFGNTLYRACRLASKGCQFGAQAIVERNKAVLLEQGMQEAERAVEREFERISNTVAKELGDYPALHRQVSEAITAIEEDYDRSREVPPVPQPWVEAVEAIAKIPRADSLSGILDNFQKSIVDMENKAVEEYRKDSKERHRLLHAARPYWQELVKRFTGTESRLQRLLDRANAIDNHMDFFTEISKGSNAAMRRLSASSLTQFFISGLVLAIAIGGAVINFHLIARPMAEMVGGNTAIGNLRVADIAALVIIMVEVSMGLFLMECMRITRLFPVINSLDDRLRIKMGWVAFIILTSLAMVEAGLAFMREILVQDELATAAALRGDGVVEASDVMWITTMAQCGMGFILPFALTFVAIPMETFAHSLRTVLGMAGVALLRGMAVIFMMIGTVFRGIGRGLANIYDIFCALPLAFSRLFRRKDKSSSSYSTVEGMQGL